MIQSTAVNELANVLSMCWMEHACPYEWFTIKVYYERDCKIPDIDNCDCDDTGPVDTEGLMRAVNPFAKLDIPFWGQFNQKQKDKDVQKDEQNQK